MTDPKEKVFPNTHEKRVQVGEVLTADVISKGGITIREYFAAVAMQGILAGQPVEDHNPQLTSMRAVDHADALIKDLNRDE